MKNNQIFVRISFTEEDYINDTNQILIPYDESLRDDISQIRNFYIKEWIIKDDRSKWIYHRPENDGPAFERVDGYKSYWLNGKRHRVNGPAIEYADGDKFYYLNGKLHRENGPAIELANGNKYYWLNGKRHRENGPAIEYADGYKEYWLNGLCHRENGPACEWSNGNKSYYLNDKRFKTKSEYLKALEEFYGK